MYGNEKSHPTDGHKHLSETQLRLLDVLTTALSDRQADEFVYEWEWDMWFFPTQTIEINGKAIHGDYNLYFDFGEKDLNELASAGYFKRVRQEKTEDGLVMRITFTRNSHDVSEREVENEKG